MNRSCLSCFMQLSNSNLNKQWCIGSWVQSGAATSKIGRGYTEKYRYYIYFLYIKYIVFFKFIYIHAHSHTQFYTDTAALIWRICGRVFFCTKVKMNMKWMSTRNSLLKYDLVFCIDALNIQLHRKVIRKYESLPFSVLNSIPSAGTDDLNPWSCIQNCSTAWGKSL